MKEVALNVSPFGICVFFITISQSFTCDECFDSSSSCHKPIDVFLKFWRNLSCITLTLIPQFESVLRNFTFVFIFYSSFLNLTQRNKLFNFLFLCYNNNCICFGRLNPYVSIRQQYLLSVV